MFHFIDSSPAMNLKTPSGERVVFTFSENGRTYDGEFAREHLELDVEYTVKCIEIGQSSSTVEFEELPGLRFNTVLFANLEEEE